MDQFAQRRRQQRYYFGCGFRYHQASAMSNLSASESSGPRDRRTARQSPKSTNVSANTTDQDTAHWPYAGVKSTVRITFSAPAPRTTLFTAASMPIGSIQ